jgi:alkylation response protein AidB-like acyl-CoA dehydrogenase
MKEKEILRGGEFLVKEQDSHDVFITEEFSEEQKMIRDTCQVFIDTEIYPILDKLDTLEDNLTHTMLKKAGELGLLGVSVPAK